ncbi:LytR/AlgR family response regulator transcription factor [Clostridium brassicae]|uniref:Stage 0 sporulation protein A homolog n=1 Tax=Clostridium brassicae TaxID=2999072 RepID=A0ABT4D853_9CLOT|nr:LytTR family DNA-binding domain-containing protein [Clostridium brassicae]MCY6958480.1 LytTR family DNA-binding domain-containing protein [Clostridium brassicae]
MFRIAVCDDEKYFLSTLENFLCKYLNKHEIQYEIDTFKSGMEFLELGIDMVKYTVIFLDINMDEIDGIMTAQKVREFSKEVFIVFVTAYINYTLEGYKVDAVRYLLKSNENFEEVINECMDAIVEKMNYAIIKKVFKFSQGVKEIRLDRILYIESRLHKLQFHIMQDKVRIYTLYGTLNKIENELEGNGFVRIHQSFLVNIKHIMSISGNSVILSNGVKLSISKSRYKGVKKIFIEYIGEI